MLKKLKQFLNWRIDTESDNQQKDFKYTTDYELYSVLASFRLPIILLILLYVIGTLGYIIIDDMSLDDAIYQAGITFTTVGFGEISPISTAGRYFTIFLIILGFTIFTFSLGLIVEIIAKGNLIRVLKERKMIYEILRLKNHIVFFYHNESTIELAKEFNRAQVPFVVVDNTENFLEEAEKYNYPYYIKAEPSSDIAFRKSHLSSAKAVVTLSSNITENIAQISTIRLFERKINKKQKYQIITLCNNIDKQRLKDLGANIVIDPNKLMAQRIISMALNESLVNLLEEFLLRKDNPIDMEEIQVPKDSWIIFKKLKEIHLREIADVSVVGIREHEGRFIPMPKGEAQILLKSTILVIGEPHNINYIKGLINQKTKPEALKFN